jgi:hypothetical protein
MNLTEVFERMLSSFSDRYGFFGPGPDRHEQLAQRFSKFSRGQQEEREVSWL